MLSLLMTAQTSLLCGAEILTSRSRFFPPCGKYAKLHLYEEHMAIYIIINKAGPSIVSTRSSRARSLNIRSRPRPGGTTVGFNRGCRRHSRRTKVRQFADGVYQRFLSRQPLSFALRRSLWLFGQSRFLSCQGRGASP